MLPISCCVMRNGDSVARQNNLFFSSVKQARKNGQKSLSLHYKVPVISAKFPLVYRIPLCIIVHPNILEIPSAPQAPILPTLILSKF
jgi:hypothetical protein